MNNKTIYMELKIYNFFHYCYLCFWGLSLPLSHRIIIEKKLDGVKIYFLMLKMFKKMIKKWKIWLSISTLQENRVSLVSVKPCFLLFTYEQTEKKQKILKNLQKQKIFLKRKKEDLHFFNHARKRTKSRMT